MKRLLILFGFCMLVCGLALAAVAELHRSYPQSVAPEKTYLGFDRNIYPGDEALPILRKTFAFTSYWLSPPPGEKTNTWLGKREFLRSQGFGFLVLYRGPQSSELRQTWSEGRAFDNLSLKRGARDARRAAGAAKKEGFPSQTVIFLDIEEGGRLPAVYHTYLRAWADELIRAGYRAGAYCSGIPVHEEPGVSITTADDIRNHGYSKEVIFWIYSDACPPSPGCVFPQTPPSPAASGISYAAVWQFAQSPRRREFTARCAATYHRDGNCYAPGDTVHSWFLDVNSAASANPSGGARQN